MKILNNKINLIKTLNRTILLFPTPVNINILWYFGSILGICLVVQIISGFFLSIHYTSHIHNAFNRVIHIKYDVNYASFFFFCILIHIVRGIYFNSYFLYLTWYRGSLIFILTIATAFLGYVLPWGKYDFEEQL